MRVAPGEMSTLAYRLVVDRVTGEVSVCDGVVKMSHKQCHEKFCFPQMYEKCLSRSVSGVFKNFFRSPAFFLLLLSLILSDRDVELKMSVIRARSQSPSSSRGDTARSESPLRGTKVGVTDLPSSVSSVERRSISLVTALVNMPLSSSSVGALSSASLGDTSAFASVGDTSAFASVGDTSAFVSVGDMSTFVSVGDGGGTKSATPKLRDACAFTMIDSRYMRNFQWAWCGGIFLPTVVHRYRVSTADVSSSVSSYVWTQVAPSTGDTHGHDVFKEQDAERARLGDELKTMASDRLERLRNRFRDFAFAICDDQDEEYVAQVYAPSHADQEFLQSVIQVLIEAGKTGVYFKPSTSRSAAYRMTQDMGFCEMYSTGDEATERFEFKSCASGSHSSKIKLRIMSNIGEENG
jgi:hypothetical protein